MKKFNNLIAKKLCANLLNTREKNQTIFSARHNSMTKLCSEQFKCENKLKIGWEN